VISLGSSTRREARSLGGGVWQLSHQRAAPKQHASHKPHTDGLKMDKGERAFCSLPVCLPQRSLGRGSLSLVCVSQDRYSHQHFDDLRMIEELSLALLGIDGDIFQHGHVVSRWLIARLFTGNPLCLSARVLCLVLTRVRAGPRAAAPCGARDRAA
jgi:hypothetical protein